MSYLDTLYKMSIYFAQFFFQELEAMRLKFKMMSNAGAIDSSALRSPTASESETTMAAALSMSPRRSDALENIR